MRFQAVDQIAFHKEDTVNASQTPGYPIASPEKSLATWTGTLSGIGDALRSAAKGKSQAEVVSPRL